MRLQSTTLILENRITQGVRTVRGFNISVLTLLALLVAIGAGAETGNLGYNSYEGYVSGGRGLKTYFGPGVGYPSGNGDSFGSPYGVSGDYMRKYVPAEQWGNFGYGSGHLGEGWGPYIWGNRSGASQRGMFDPLPQPYNEAPPPSIKIKRGHILVGLPKDIPGVKCVTVTILAFNGAELCSDSKQSPPFAFDLPVMDGVKNVRVRIDYVNDNLSATSYPL